MEPSFAVKHRLLHLLIGIFLCTWLPCQQLIAAPSSRPSTASATHQIESPLETLLASKQFQKIIKRLHKKSKRNEAESLALARAYFYAKQYKQAAETALQFVSLYPTSPNKTKAHLLAAMAYNEAKMHDQAQRIYVLHIKAHFSRKARLKRAQQYLSFVKRYQSTKGQAKPKLAKAAAYLKLALDHFSFNEPTRRKLALQLGILYLKTNSTWWARYYLQKEANKTPTDRYTEAALFYLAKTYIKRRQYTEARSTLRKLQKQYPRSKWSPHTYAFLAQTYGVPGRSNRHYQTIGLGLLRTLVKRFSTHPLAVKAAFDIAQTQKRAGKYKAAIKSYAQFVKAYGKQAPTKQRYVARARFQIGHCFTLQQKYKQSIKAFSTFLSKHPTDQNWPQAQRMIVNIRYTIASHFLKRKQWKLARQALTAFVARYPLERRNAKALWQIGQTYAKQKQYERALQVFRKVASKYPTQTWGYRAKWDIATLLHAHLKRYKEAIAAYKAMRYWRNRRRARTVIRQLTRPALHVLTPTIFSPGKQAAVLATSRNIKDLQVRLYRINAETYFRKMKCTSGMDKLDIQLIRPDRTWKVHTKHNKPYHLHKTPIHIPSNKPMVAVLHISGKQKQATTIVRVSQLQIISKSNRHSLFVFAYHTKTKQPQANARIIVSNGSKIILEGKTNAKGIYQVQHKSLRFTKQLKILALSRGSVASSELYLSGTEQRRTRQPIGLLYTNRSVYRPGEVVHFHGIVREVTKGQHTPPTTPYTLTITTNHAREIHKQALKPSKFGTFNSLLVTNPLTTTGTYTATLSTHNKTYRTTFHIRSANPPEYTMTLNVNRHVLQRGQHIQATIKVRHGFGQPAANKIVTYNIGKKTQTAKTNAQGTIALKIPTHLLKGNATHTLTASLKHTYLKAKQSIWLRKTAFNLSLSTKRNIVLANETFPLTIKAIVPDKSTPKATVALRWFRIQKRFGKQHRTKVGHRTLTLHKQSSARLSMTLKKGGYYLFQASTKDASGQHISAEYRVFVSDKQDHQALRLLTNQTQVRAGTHAKLQIVARKPGVALLTIETDRVVYHKQIIFKTPHTKAIQLPVKTSYYPNFAVRVTLLHNQKQRTVSQHFAVKRKLHIALNTNKSSWKPGQTVSLTIKTKDQNGAPTPAYLSLSIVDSKLGVLFPHKVPVLAKTFGQFKRHLQMETRASNTYRHQSGDSHLANQAKQWLTRRTSSLANQGLQSANQPPNYRFLRQIRQQRLQIGNLDANVQNRRVQRRVRHSHTQRLGASLQSLKPLVAYWHPTIGTNKQGIATLRIQLPKRATTWQLNVRGVALPTLVGEATQQIVVKQGKSSPTKNKQQAVTSRRTKAPHTPTQMGTDPLAIIYQALQETNTRHTSLGHLAYQLMILDAIAPLTYVLNTKSSRLPNGGRIITKRSQLIQSIWLQLPSYKGWSYLGTRSSFGGRYRFRRWYHKSDALLTAQLIPTLMRWKKAVPQSLQRTTQLRRYLKQEYYKASREADKALLMLGLLHLPKHNRTELFSYANRLFRQRTRLSLLTLSRLAHSLRMLKRVRLAKALRKHIEQKLLRGGVRILKKHESPFAQERPLHIMEGLEALAYIAPTSNVLPRGMSWLSRQRKGQNWGSIVHALHAIRVQAAYKKQKIKTKMYTIQATQLAKHNMYVISRQYLPAPRRVMGNLIKRGFGKQKAGKTYKKWTTFVKAIPYGGYVTVKLRIKRRFPQNDHTTVVVEEPIPTGGFVLPSSIKTYKAHAQVMPGKILFTLPKRHNQWIIQYRIYGARPGSYNIPGTSVRSFVKPDFRATGQPHRLTVLAKGSKQHPRYKLTPDELYDIGMTYYNAKKWKLARKYLTQLDNQFVLRRYYQNKVAKALLQLVLKDKQHPLLIKYFERVKEQSPSLVLPFSQIVKVGEAYAKQKEYERSSMIFAAILQAHFLHDLKIAAALEKQGEFKAAARFTEELCKQYPDFKAIQEAMYGLAQTAFQQASRKRKKPKQFKHWLARAERLFRQFITMYPTHPSVDVAAYSRANVIMEQKRRNHAIAYLGTIGERYQDSKELDSMHYLRAYGLYLTRKNRDALELLQYVSTADYTTSNGKLGKSKHQYLARYLIAQLYHANAEWQKALSWYSKVKTKFSDAKAQVEHFKKKQLRIPEVTVVGTKDKATIALTHQNIKAITLLAYRVDLVKLYLQKKNLRNVTRINLAGIQPTYRRKHTLGNGMEFQSKTTKLTLPLQKRGAYLIVLKAREREVSGILLRTRLKLKVHEQQASGRVTVHLLGRTNQRPFADTTVRVIGSGHKTIHTGSTDLRGIFSVENVRGTTTILAQRGDDFAFYRGTLDLQWSKRPKPPRAQQRRYGRYNWRRRRRRQRRRPSKRIAPSMLEHINKGNTSNILRGRSGMLKLYKKSQRGVQMDSLF